MSVHLVKKSPVIKQIPADVDSKRLTSLERSQLLRYGAALDILMEPYADDRFAMVKGGKRDLAMVRKKMQTLLAQALETVPLDQLRQLRQHMKHARVKVGITAMTVEENDRTYGSFLTNKAMQALAVASQDTCRMCMLDKHKAKKCPLRAALDEMWIQGVEGTENECPYYQL